MVAHVTTASFQGIEAVPVDVQFLLAPENLIQLANQLRGTQVLSGPKSAIHAAADNLPDLSDIKSQETARRRWKWSQPVTTTCSDMHDFKTQF